MIFRVGVGDGLASAQGSSVHLHESDLLSRTSFRIVRIHYDCTGAKTSRVGKIAIAASLNITEEVL